MNYEIIAKGEIILKHITQCENFSEQLQSQISTYWNDYIRSKNKSAFNDKVLRFVRINPTNKNMIEVTYTDYKNIIVNREFLNSSLEISQIGVSGLALVKEQNDFFVLFAKRSKAVTEYQGFYELVPSGNLDKSVLDKDETINFRAKILDEFEEETGLPRSAVNNVSSFCLVKDNVNHVYDVCCILELAVDRNSLNDSFKNVSEFHSPCFVDIKNLKNFLNKNDLDIVPTSKAILQHFLEKNNQP